jgi:hypothetical protein
MMMWMNVDGQGRAIVRCTLSKGCYRRKSRAREKKKEPSLITGEPPHTLGSKRKQDSSGPERYCSGMLLSVKIVD